MTENNSSSLHADGKDSVTNNRFLEWYLALPHSWKIRQLVVREDFLHSLPGSGKLSLSQESVIEVQEVISQRAFRINFLALETVVVWPSACGNDNDHSSIPPSVHPALTVLRARVRGRPGHKGATSKGTAGARQSDSPLDTNERAGKQYPMLRALSKSTELGTRHHRSQGPEANTRKNRRSENC